MDYGLPRNGSLLRNDLLLHIEGLHVTYRPVVGEVRAIEDVNLSIGPKEFVVAVGESGSGKSTLILSIIGLLPERANVLGKIYYKNLNLLELDRNGWRKFRGTEIGMIFQEPMTSLNPIEKVRNQMAETISRASVHQVFDSNRENQPIGAISGHVGQESGVKERGKVDQEVLNWLRKVRIPDPESVAQRYPFQLSGGMMQRVMIAMALSLRPSLLLADEPTTALDVTTQAQVLKLMKSLIEEAGTSIVLVTHDLGVAAQVGDRILVLYAGEIVEEGTANQIFSNPLHPYTEGLLRCYPKSVQSKERLETLIGSIPDLRAEIRGCKFAERCPHVKDVCRAESPKYVQVEPDHYAKCILY